ncbi:MAG TPA: hypothetical protein PLA87_13270 [Pseudomonadota bacterium]|nr:hypothetical protein [Pseudomonadota bacterium]
MSYSRSGAIAMFHDLVPLEFLRGFAERLHKSYRGAFLLCRETFNRPERHDLHSSIRRAVTEAHFRDLAKVHQADVTSCQTKRGTAHYSRARFGTVVLTQCGVAQKNEVVRRAQHRENLAIGQMSLFGQEQTEAEGMLYVLLLHGPRKAEVPSPTFLRAAFPSPDCKTYSAIIDLTFLLAAAAADTVSTATEDDDELIIRLRPQIEEDNEEMG